MLEMGKITFHRLYNFLHHHDIMFKFSPQGYRFHKLSQVLNQYTGISWIMVVQVCILSDYIVTLERDKLHCE